MKIVVVGSGGVGGFFGGRLAARGSQGSQGSPASQGPDVTFVARGAHLAAMRERGLYIRSPNGDLHLERVHATDDTTTIGPADVVLFAVKLYDMATALESLKPLIGANTVVIPLQNGVAAVDLVRQTVGDEHAAGGTCYVSAVVDAPGVIRHTAMGRLIFGPLAGATGPLAGAAPAPLAQLTKLLAACQGAGFEATLSERIQSEIWAKFVRLTAFSGMTAATRCPLGVVMSDPELTEMLVAALTESFAIARANNVDLDPSVVPAIIESYRTMPPGTKSSMLEDLERGRRLELPFLSGTVARMGAALGVPTPTHHFIATVLKPFANGRSSGLSNSR
jgi:2-dehydropantoate 2-reductase